MLNPQLQLQESRADSAPKATRDGFGAALLELGQTHPNVLVLTADLAESTQVEPFAKAYQDRFYDLGVAEQNLMSVGGGLAACGHIPFITSYAMFSPGRNWEQLRNTVCYGRLNVKVASSHAGLSVGPDGATHQALEDIALTRALPHLTIISPCDYEQAKQATHAAVAHSGPVYLRLSRYPGPQITTGQSGFDIGPAQIIRYGQKVTIVATGIMVAEALKAGDELDGEVINIHTIKPLDIQAIAHSTQKTGKLIVIEEHQLAGGLGSAILEAYAQLGLPIPPVRLMAVADQFGQSGTADELLAAHNLTWEHIINQAHSF